MIREVATGKNRHYFFPLGILIQGIPVDIGYRVCNHKSDKWSSVLIQQAIEKKIFDPS